MSELWFVDDNEENRSQFEGFYEDRYSVRVFESALDAFRSMTTPDTVVIDCSAVGSVLSPHTMYGPICSLIGKHPNAKYFIRSAMPFDLIQGVVDDVKRECPETVVIPAGWGQLGSLLP